MCLCINLLLPPGLRGESESWERAKKLLLGAVDVVLQLKGETLGIAKFSLHLKTIVSKILEETKLRKEKHLGITKLKKVLMKSIDACLVTSHLK